MPTKKDQFALSPEVIQLLDSYQKIYGGDRKVLEYDAWYSTRYHGTADVIIADLRARKSHREWSDFSEDRKQLESVCARRLEKPSGVIKGKYKCKNAKCKGDEFLLEPKQTRSSDEGETLFCKCVDCGQVMKG